MSALAGQRVAVVGGASGIGLAVARLATEAGAEVEVHDVDAAGLERIGALLPAARRVRVDVLDEAAVAAAFAGAGRLDHVYVAAGATRPVSILEGPLADQLALVDLRVRGSAHVVRAAARRVRPGGSFTFTGAVSTDRPVRGAWATSVATAAAEQLARALAIELAPIRCNAVAPGWTDTPMWERLLGDQRAAVFAEVSQRQLIGRLGTADEVARAVLLLMQNEAITGEILHVDGGGRLT